MRQIPIIILLVKPSSEKELEKLEQRIVAKHKKMIRRMA
jgi:hypothetical protein